jgi:hypothetical protein
MTVLIKSVFFCILVSHIISDFYKIFQVKNGPIKMLKTACDSPYGDKQTFKVLRNSLLKYRRSCTDKLLWPKVRQKLCVSQEGGDIILCFVIKKINTTHNPF